MQEQEKVHVVKGIWKSRCICIYCIYVRYDVIPKNTKKRITSSVSISNKVRAESNKRSEKKKERKAEDGPR